MIDRKIHLRHHYLMQTRFTLRQILYFLTAAETGSIVAASRVLNISSPSISTALTQLEEELGTTLFVRQRAHGLSLTEAGRILATQAEKILSEATELTRLASSISDTVQGPLRLGCLTSFAQIVVPSLRRSFETEYPSVRLSQIELTQPEIFTALRRSEIDLALTYGIDVPNDLDFHPIKTLPPLVLLASDHPLAQHETLSAKDLADHAMVLLDLPLSSDYFLSLFSQANVKPMIAERSKDMAVVRSLVANDFGYSIVNFRPLVTLSPDGKPLVTVPLKSAVPPISIGLVSAKGALDRRTGAAFLKHCQKEI